LHGRHTTLLIQVKGATTARESPAAEMPLAQPGRIPQCDNLLSNRVFKSYDDLVDHCCETWNKLIDQP
jgi:hypothetical protein